MHNFFKTSPPSPFIITTLYLGITIINALLVVLTLMLFPHISPFLFFIPIIAYMSGYAGFIGGAITTIVSMVCVTLLLFFPTNQTLITADLNVFIELLMLFFIGLFISYSIDKAKQQNKITGYQKQIRQNTQLIETLERNYENAQKEIKSRDQFLAIASHELKTPVTSMLLQVQSAIHNIRNVSLANFSVENLLKMLEGTEQQSQRLSKMVNDLLNLSLITTGRMDLELEEADLSKLVKDVTDRFSERLKKENITLHLDAPQPVLGKWDTVRVEQAVINLVSNAIKYGDKKPVIMQVRQTNDHAKLTVKDHGIGIPHDHQKRIFERFERAVSAKDYQGLGVGLYITNQIVKAHNGKITIDSKPGNGTTFVIELPRKPKLRK